MLHSGRILAWSGIAQPKQARTNASVYNPPHRSTLMSTLMHELPRRHRITVEHFYRMAEAGLFAEDERVELIDGEIIDVPPMGHQLTPGWLACLTPSCCMSCPAGARALVRSAAAVAARRGCGTLARHRGGKTARRPLPAKPPHGGRCLARDRGEQHYAAIRSQPQGTDVRSPRRARDLGARRGRPAGSISYRSPRDGAYAATSTVPLATRAWRSTPSNARSTCGRSPRCSPNPTRSKR